MISELFARQLRFTFEAIVLFEHGIDPIIPTVSYDLLQLSVQDYTI
jgi:hypothetical protein